MIRLERYIQKGSARLRMGYTTGTCAAGAARAAAEMLLGKVDIPIVWVRTPGNIAVELEIEESVRGTDFVCCGVHKDSGDDPDVTDGLQVRAKVTRMDEGFLIEGGEGVGRVTKPGLPCPVGSAAINPVPGEMIRNELEQACNKHGYQGGLRVELSVPGGNKIAGRTFNPRLGIVGGISILGTSGVVEPMSETALLETIRLEIGSKKAAGEEVLLLTPGNYGRDFAWKQFGVELDAGVKCSNFIGDALDFAGGARFSNILLLGHVGKLVKLAAGVMNTHSRVADCRMEVLCAHGGLCGLDPERLAVLMNCATVDAADILLLEWGVADQVWQSISTRVQKNLDCRVEGAGGGKVLFGAFARRGLVMCSPGLKELIAKMNNGIGGGRDE